MRVLWTLAAEQDRANIVDFLALIPHESYRVAFEVNADAVWILALGVSEKRFAGRGNCDRI